MKTNSGRLIQIAFYALAIVGIVFLMIITRECGRMEGPKYSEGYSGGDTLDIAIVYGPESMYSGNDTLGGINYDLIREFSLQYPRPIKVWPVSNVSDAMDNLENGAFHLLASLPLDNEIKSRFPATESIFLDRMVLLQLKDSVTGKTEINSSLDLDGKTVYVASGSPAFKRLENISREIGGDIQIIEEKDLSEELISIKVATGDFPLAVVNEKTAFKMSQTYPLLSYDNPVSFTRFQVWLLYPGDTVLLNQVNEWFDEFRLTDSYRNIIDRY